MFGSGSCEDCLRLVRWAEKRKGRRARGDLPLGLVAIARRLRFNVRCYVVFDAVETGALLI